MVVSTSQQILKLVELIIRVYIAQAIAFLTLTLDKHIVHFI